MTIAVPYSNEWRGKRVIPEDIEYHDRLSPLHIWLDRLETASPKEGDDLIWARCAWDLEAFALLFFEYRFTSAFSVFHRSLLERPKEAWHRRANQEKELIEAPRGLAKSTIVSFLDVVHDVVYGYEAFVGIISTNFDLSKGLVEDLYSTFKHHDRASELHRIYGPFVVEGTKTSFVVHCPGVAPGIGCAIRAYSVGGTCRGHKHAGLRFTKWVLDDIEHPLKVRNIEQRNYTEQFIDGDVCKSGRSYTIFRYVGTRLHEDSVSARKAASPGWISKRWKSVIEWPTHTHLWDECHQIWADLDNPARREDAELFYLANQDAMDEGSEVLWPESEPIYVLYQMLWEDGPSSFFTEKQNDPSASGSTLIKKSDMRWFTLDNDVIRTEDGSVISLRSCTIAIYLDPSLGKRLVRRDPACVAVVARGPSGYRYLLDVELLRAPPSEQRAAVWRAWERFPSAEVGTENAGMQALFEEAFEMEKKDRRSRGLPWQMRIDLLTSSDEKHARIARLEPDVINGWLLFSRDLCDDVIKQITGFPNEIHDDAPDAIERADWLALNSRRTARIGGRR